MNIVYWSVFPKDIDFIHNMPPVSIREKYKNISLDRRHNFNLCPAYHREANKTYNILAPFDYDLIFTGDGISTTYYNQHVFDKFITINDFKLRLIQIDIEYLFFAENSCNMILGAPYFSNSDLIDKIQYIPGSFKINNWLRSINVPCIVNQEVDKLQIKRGDPLLSVKFDFDNDLPIKFKKFYISTELANIVSMGLKSKIFFTKNISNYFNQLYTKFTDSKIKKVILREINNNLME